jgi:NADPH:quinone reductase-like Zn-dependent oxidoreductase
MKALALTEFDAPPAVIDVPDPTPAPGEVLVRVAAASVNPYDAFVAMGGMKEYLAYEFPAVIGMDVAGTIEALGDGVDGFALGDRVFGTIGTKATVHDGSFAELAPAQAAALARTPDGVDHRDVAYLGLAGTTALGAVEALEALDGANVLIVGATGGVGSFAIQLGAARGAHVTASVRPGDEPFVTELGASETVDHTDDVAAAIRERHPDGIDGLIDLVSRDPAGFASLVGLVRAGGHATSSVGGAGESTEIGGVAVSNVGGNPALLPALGELVKEGRLWAPIQRTYPLDEAATALRDLTDQHTLGKLLIEIG